MMNDRIALRLGALRLARRRGRTRDAAWAASRLRLAGVTLEPGDARFSRDVRVKLGRALRIARVRRATAPLPTVALPLLPATKVRKRERLAAALLAAALLITLLYLYVRLSEPRGGPEGAQPAQQAVAIATPPPPLRGRSQPGVAAPVAIVEVTPAPTDAPATPAPVGPGTGTTGGGNAGGGSGGGTGAGNGLGTPAPAKTPVPAKPTATPTPAPTVTIDPSKLMHVDGTIVDSRSRKPIPNVCVSIGSSNSCFTYTDAKGFFAVDLEIGKVLNWQFLFLTPGYTTGKITVPARPGTTHLGLRGLTVAP